MFLNSSFVSFSQFVIIITSWKCEGWDTENCGDDSDNMNKGSLEKPKHTVEETAFLGVLFSWNIPQ